MSTERWDCPCGVTNPPGRTTCRGCGTAFDAAQRYKLDGVSDQDRELGRLDYMPTSTTPEIPGHQTLECLGVLTAEAVMGVHIFKDIAASFADVFGGRVASYENELKKAVRLALFSLKEQAETLGANALVGVRIDYEVVGGSSLMIAAQGTAVKTEPRPPSAR